MKRTLRLVLVALLISPLFVSCDTNDPIDELDTQGNDRVIRKKPGRTTHTN